MTDKTLDEIFRVGIERFQTDKNAVPIGKTLYDFVLEMMEQAFELGKASKGRFTVLDLEAAKAGAFERGKTAGAYCQLCKKPRTDVGLCCVDCFQEAERQAIQAGRDEKATEDHASFKRLHEKIAALSKEKEALEAELKQERDTKLACICGDKMKCSDARQADAFAIRKTKEEVAHLRDVLESVKISFIRFCLSEGDWYTGEISHIDAEAEIVKALGLPADEMGWLDKERAKKALGAKI